MTNQSNNEKEFVEEKITEIFDDKYRHSIAVDDPYGVDNLEADIKKALHEALSHGKSLGAAEERERVCEALEEAYKYIDYRVKVFKDGVDKNPSRAGKALVPAIEGEMDMMKTKLSSLLTTPPESGKQEETGDIKN